MDGALILCVQTCVFRFTDCVKDQNIVYKDVTLIRRFRTQFARMGIITIL